jgi:ferredoxin-fold anticodon binding domain-containing protein
MPVSLLWKNVWKYLLEFKAYILTCALKVIFSNVNVITIYNEQKLKTTQISITYRIEFYTAMKMKNYNYWNNIDGFHEIILSKRSRHKRAHRIILII